MPETKSNHQVNIVKIDSIRKHPNADKLELIDVRGYQVVSQKGQFHLGDFGVYIQPDSVVPQTEPFRFIWGNYVTEDGTVPERRRRITVRKFRKEWSEGLLMPLADFPELHKYEGMLVNQIPDVGPDLGIYHYQPPEPEDRSLPHNYNKGVWPRSLKGWWYFILHKLGILRDPLHGRNVKAPATNWCPVYDVEALKNFKHAFEDGEAVVVTEKIHGSNARFTFQDGKMHAGSRQLWKHDRSNCVWREALKQNPWIEEWCRAHENYAVYGEVVPTQGSFRYGCAEGQVKFFPFDILQPNGEWLPVGEWPTVGKGLQNAVPLLYRGPFGVEMVKSFVEGKSMVADHIREGIVIRPINERYVPGLGRLQLKIVSNQFLNLDSQ